MSIQDLHTWDDRDHSKGEAMAFRIRCRVLYNLLRYDTKRPRNELIAGLLGVHVQTVTKWRGAHSRIGRHAWTTLKLAEIAAKRDPKAVVQYVEDRLQKIERKEPQSLISKAVREIGATATLEGVK